jgi:hypothetical protein
MVETVSRPVVLRIEGPSSLEPVGVVNEAVEDGVGEGRFADDVVPDIDR